jgi:hypothetical protein
LGPLIWLLIGVPEIYIATFVGWHWSDQHRSTAALCENNTSPQTN